MVIPFVLIGQIILGDKKSIANINEKRAYTFESFILIASLLF